jgi:CheY-like chemotaxis protein
LNSIQSEIYTDKTKLTQILSNLISNALKFTHKGKIEFGYTMIDSDNQKKLKFYVKDTGIGVDKKYHDKIFNRFRQADKSIQINYGGNGLGLSIAKGFTELLGGNIWIESEKDKGSAFYFNIPYRPVNKTNNTGSLEKKSNNIILVVEDEENNYLFIEEVLSDIGIKTIHAVNGENAIEIFKYNIDISLILMDIKLPGMNGDEVAKIIKSYKSTIPIIAQSAYALEHEIARYEGIFDDYITKPAKETVLIETVIKYLQ